MRGTVWVLAAAAAAALPAAALAAAAPPAGVTQLTDASFHTQVLEADAPWLVDVADAASDDRLARLGELARALQGSGVRVGFVDRSHDRACAADAPAGLVLFGLDKGGKTPRPALIAPARGALDPGTAAEKALDAIRDGVLQRLGKRSTKPKPNQQQQQQQHKKQQQQQRGSSDEKPLDLTDSSFDDTVGGSDDAFLVAFVAPWCGHCKALHPEWQQAARELAGTGVRVASVDATANEALARRFGIQGFPTIKFFPPGATHKSDADAVDYPQARTAAAITQWALSEFERRGGRVHVHVPELVSQDGFDDACAARGRCVLAFLPPLLDTGKRGREELLAELHEAQRQARHVRFAWAEAGAQPAWERAYALEFGWPAVLLLRRHQGRELGLVMRGGAFTGPALAAFASAGKKLGEFEEAGWPRVQLAEPWDGEEPASVPGADDDDDDFDLDAFMAED